MPDDNDSAERAIKEFEARLAASAAQRHHAPPQIASSGPVISEATSPKWLHPFTLFIGPYFSRWIARHQVLAAAIGFVFVILALYEVVGLPIGLSTQQAIINQSKIDQAKAEACSARIKAIIDTVPMNEVGAATELVQRDCDPTYAARVKDCDNRFQTLLNEIDHMDGADPSALNELTEKITAHKGKCGISAAQSEAATAKSAKFAARQKEADQALGLIQAVKLSNQAQIEERAGHYDKAFELFQTYADAAEAYDNKTSGKPGELSAEAFSGLAFYAVLAHKFNTALAAADHSLKIIPDQPTPLANRAHALMFLGHADEALAVYYAHKGERFPAIQNKTWEEVIAGDFDKFRHAGRSHPLMDHVEKAFRAGDPASPPSISVNSETQKIIDEAMKKLEAARLHPSGR